MAVENGMDIAANLPENMLRTNHLYFLEDWGVGQIATYYPMEPGRGLHIWHGTFIDGETVTIIGREDMCQNTWIDPLFVGVAFENDQLPEAPLEVYINAAEHLASGLHKAIDLLNEIRGLPCRRRLDLRNL